MVESEYSIFTVRRDTCVSPRTGAEHDFIVLESPDWVSVVATAADGRLVLVRQYRHGLGDVTLEIPGGLVDKGDAPEKAARKELREETGYGGGHWRVLGRLAPLPPVFTNWLHVFLATGVVPLGPPELDAGEDITVELHPVDEVRRMVAGGEIVHAQVVAALSLHDAHLRTREERAT